MNLTPSKLAIALLFTETCVEIIEENLVHAYMNTFGDAPPLNYRV
jgi:hypothetical protein